jgi:hypothetical protein
MANGEKPQTLTPSARSRFQAQSTSATFRKDRYPSAFALSRLAPMPAVVKILCTSHFPGDHGSERTLWAAQCDDGTFRLYLDQQPLKGFNWRQPETCIDEFLRVAHSLRVQQTGGLAAAG